jgi:hypothetical protein
LLVLASLVAGFALGEVALRIVRPNARQPFVVRQSMESERGKFCVYDPQLGWTGKPNADASFRFVDCQHHVRQNRYGFRGTEYDFARTETPRLLVLGDSFVWGFGVENDQIFTHLVERQSDAALEVVNLGVSGYGTDQELLLWRSLGKRFAPDRVLLVLCPYTDLSENVASIKYGYPKPLFHFETDGHRIENQPVPESHPDAWESGLTQSGAATAALAQRPALARLATHSALISSAILALARFDGPRRMLETRRILPERDHSLSWGLLAHGDPPSEQAAASWRTLFRLVDLLHEDVLASGATLEVLIVPSVIQVYPDLWQRFVRNTPPPARSRWNRDAPNERIAAYCRKKGIQVIDPLPALRAAAETDLFLYFPWNSHWTPAAHRLVAEEILGGPQRAERRLQTTDPD